MKKPLFVFLAVLLVASGCAFTNQKNTSQTVPNPVPPVASSTPQIQYSNNPKIIGKELAGLTSIPDKYKPEDTVIDIDALAAPYLQGTIKMAAWQIQKDPDELFEVEGFGISNSEIQTSRRTVELDFKWPVVINIYTDLSKINLSKPPYPFRVKSKNLNGYEVYVNRGLQEFGIFQTRNGKTVYYNIDYVIMPPPMSPNGTPITDYGPYSNKPASELYTTVSTFRFLK